MSILIRHTVRHIRTTADKVFQKLTENILGGTFPVGMRLREARIAREWKVSRTPLREAIRRASEAGFVVLRPHQAPLVRPLSATDIHDLYALRELLEVRAVELAWPRFDAAKIRDLQAADPNNARSKNRYRQCLAFDLELHQSWMNLCGNSWLAADLERLYQFLRIFQNLIGRDREKLEQAYVEHLAILDAIRRRDKAAAIARLREHIGQSAAAVIQVLAGESFSKDVPG